MRLIVHWVPLCVALLTSACGGGGGDQLILPPPVTPASGDSGSAPVALSSSLSGTVAVGAPVVGASVQAKCLGGTVSAIALTDSRGGFSIELSNVAAPCMLQASGGSAQGVPLTEPLHGLALASGTAHVSPWTELALARNWAQHPASLYSGFNGRDQVPSRSQLDLARQWLNTQLQAVGVNELSDNPFQGTFVLGEGNDLLLDQLQSMLQSQNATWSDLRQAAVNGESLQASMTAAQQREQERQAAEEAARLAALAAEAEADTVRGVVKAPSPVANGRVTLRCMQGTPQSGVTTDAQGRFAVRRYGASLPCMVQVSGGSVSGQAHALPLHGWVTAQSAATVRVTPLSELVLSHAWAQAPANIMSAPSVATWPRAEAIDTALQWLNTQWSELGFARGPGSVLQGQEDPTLAQPVSDLLARLDQTDSTLASILPVAVARGSLKTTIDADRQVSIAFEARSGDTPIGCGQVLSGMGSTLATGRLMDFRFYISNAQLIREDGALQPIVLAGNNAWQHTSTRGDTVTLIDLEDGTDQCGEEGNAPMNRLLNGSVPAGRYTGLLMTLGVPTALNHSDTAKAPAPLDSSAMGWGWQAGRKFMKVELTEGTEGSWPLRSPTFYVHLGSTDCTGSPVQGTVNCRVGNRGLIRLDTFDPRQHKIVVDIQALLAGTNVTINQGGSGGCMSQGTDLDCLHVFEALGIDWSSNGQGTGLPLDGGRTQTVFRRVDK